MPTTHVPLGSGNSGAASAMESSSWGGAAVFLYLLSGVTALAYQVLWARILSLQFGVSIFGVTVTVVAFMLGLGIGSLWGGRLKLRVHPLIFFALLELSVAVFAFIIPRLFGWVNAEINHADVVSGLTGWYGLQFVVTLAMLFLPATLLGLSFPTILRAVKSLPVTLGAIYGANALGGAIGAILPLVLLPVLGWLVSNALIALLGVFVSLFAFCLSFKIKVPSQAVVAGEAVALEDSRSGEVTLAWGGALAYACVGAAGLMLEVGWTRLYGMILLRTEYVMAVILAVFLMGIAFGSLVVKRNFHERWLTLLPIVGSFFALLSLWGLPWLAEWMESSHFDSLGSALFFQALVLALLTLPVTMVLGAWLPMLSIKLGKANAQLGARLYGINSVGAALGAIIAGLLVIPTVGTPATIVIAALLMFIAGMRWSSQQWAWLALVPLIAMAVPVIQLPAVQVLLPVTQRDSRDLYQHEDAISLTHVVERSDGQRLLLDDLQRMDASTDPAAVSAQQNQARLPLMLHPNPLSVLFLGVGTGISVSGSLPYDALRRVGVELSQGAISAMQPWFGVVNGGVLSKMEVVRDDARRFLQRSTDRFDVIIGDLFHPDLVGRSSLLSVEQFERVKQRLAVDGLFVQWLALNQFDPSSLQVVLRSFKSVFPAGVMFVDGFRLAMVGTQGGSFPSALGVSANLGRLTEVQRLQVTGGEGMWTWLGRYMGPIPLTSGPVQEELAPYIEYQLPKMRYGRDINLPSLLATLLDQRPDVVLAGTQLNVNSNEMEKFERNYIATGLAMRSWQAAIAGEPGEAERLIRFAYNANPDDRWIGFDLADRLFATVDQAVAAGLPRRGALQRVLEIRPDHEGALQGLRRLALVEGDLSSAASYEIQIRAVNPLGKQE